MSFKCSQKAEMRPAIFFSFTLWLRLAVVLGLSQTQATRRDVLLAAQQASAATAFGVLLSSPNEAEAVRDTGETATYLHNQSRLLLPNSKTKALTIPRIGYSMYKTTADQIEAGIQLALQAGTRHFDVATQYGTNPVVGETLRSYIHQGLSSEYTTTSIIPKSPQERRREIFLTHKISNDEQSTKPREVKNAIISQQRGPLKGIDIDLAMLHSPLTDKSRRLASYEALLDLEAKSKIKAVGVCHFGVAALQELVDAGLPAPSVIQLIISPFNQHKDIVEWASKHDSVVSCSAWSKLSSVEGPQIGWSVLGEIAKERSMTKQQVLIQWTLQKGFICTPRGSSKFNIERMAIQENSWDAVQDFRLTETEMDILDGLDEQLPAGRLGIRDGWDESQITDPAWDPTFIS
jgi:diketogulonate reductase-like aldo/keto reductase